MEMNGERRIPAPRQRVWDALNKPEMLKTAIPGCESVTKTADDGRTPGRRADHAGAGSSAARRDG
jgi:carbon monoxide dehydrogenase subunit G